LAFDPEGGLINVLTVDVQDSQICTVRSVINPDKLRHLGVPLSQFAQRSGRELRARATSATDGQG
jgi:hypothetical protein